MIGLVRRVLLYCMGLFALALGVAFSINSGLGVSPTNSLPYVVSLVLDMDLAVAVTAVFSVYTLLQIIILRKEFKWINLTQVIFATIFGYFTDLGKFLIGDFYIPTYLGQLVMLAISIILVAIGLNLYLDAKLVSMPMEGLAQAITHKLKKHPFHNVKVGVDIFSVVTASTLSLLFLGGLIGIREGTIISAILVGKCMPVVKRFTKPLTDKITGEEPDAKSDLLKMRMKKKKIDKKFT